MCLTPKAMVAHIEFIVRPIDNSHLEFMVAHIEFMGLFVPSACYIRSETLFIQLGVCHYFVKRHPQLELTPLSCPPSPSGYSMTVQPEPVNPPLLPRSRQGKLPASVSR